MYLMTTNVKGTSSMKLHRDLTSSRRERRGSPAHRIRQVDSGHGALRGPVEADETYMSGKSKPTNTRSRNCVSGVRSCRKDCRCLSGTERPAGRRCSHLATTQETLGNFLSARTNPRRWSIRTNTEPTRGTSRTTRPTTVRPVDRLAKRTRTESQSFWSLPRGPITESLPPDELPSTCIASSG